jgi:hypothetical protein
MLLLKNIFVILHVITAAAWFGLGLRLSGQARSVTLLEPAKAMPLANDIGRSVYYMNVFIVLTLVFSVVAFLLGGAFAGYGPVYHTSLLLIVIMTAVQLFVIRTGWNNLHDALSKNTGDTEPYRKRVAMGTGIGHLLWLVILVLMFWNQIAPAFR